MKLSLILVNTLLFTAESFTLSKSKQRRGFALERSTTTSSSSDIAECSVGAERRDVVKFASTLAITGAAGLLGNPSTSEARLEAVNRPDLLPEEPGKNVIQIEKFLTNGQAKRLDEKLKKLEEATGFRVRVLCQKYPQTPGLAVRDYWDLGKEDSKDDKFVVLVVDQFGGKGNILNFNVGEGVKFALPNVFWTRLQGKYGSIFFVKENGIDAAIESAIDAVYTCLRSEDAYCVNVPDPAYDLQLLK